MSRIPCSDIRNGDFIRIQGRISQIIRISGNEPHSYLGVDVFTKQLHEEAASKDDLTMPGADLKDWTVLDLGHGYVTCMTSTGDVKQGVPVLDQSNLWSRLQHAFQSGSAGVSVLIATDDDGRELVVEIKPKETKEADKSS